MFHTLNTSPSPASLPEAAWLCACIATWCRRLPHAARRRVSIHPSPSLAMLQLYNTFLIRKNGLIWRWKKMLMKVRDQASPLCLTVRRPQQPEARQHIAHRRFMMQREWAETIVPAIWLHLHYTASQTIAHQQLTGLEIHLLTLLLVIFLKTELSIRLSFFYLLKCAYYKCFYCYFLVFMPQTVFYYGRKGLEQGYQT